MYKRYLLLILFFATTLNISFTQSPFNFSIEMKPVTIPGVIGLHSYASAQSNGKWLIIGGRKDGIHARQPFNAFPQNQNNNLIYVIDPVTKQVWSSSLQSLPVSIAEQLQSTNMCYHQVNDTLYIVGGYSFSPTINDHITYPNLTTISVSNTIDAVIQQNDISPFFHQIVDQNMAVTGGNLVYYNDQFYLVGGHRFDGRYNPMGNATYTQIYTDEIRKFKINSSFSPSVTNYETISDALHLHRRDFNLIPQIFPNGENGWMISSGVFQVNADLPFLYPVEISTNGILPRTDFNQFLSHYHSAKASFYDSTNQKMQTLFFGGMSQYQYMNGSLVQDNQVPFVKTISLLNRNADNTLEEFQLIEEMPGLKGASAEFFPNLSLNHYPNDIFKINSFVSDTTIIGHIYGGILSSSTNPFSNNQTNQTQADPSIYEVRLIKNKQNGITKLDGSNPFTLIVAPNPVKNVINVQLSNIQNHSNNIENISYFLISNEGKIVQSGEESNSSFKIHLNKKIAHQQLMLQICINNQYFVNEKIIIE